MFHKIFIASVFFLIMACHPAERQVLIRGKIVNPGDEKVVLHRDYIPHQFLEAKLDKKGFFQFSFPLRNDTVLYIKNGWFLNYLFIAPGDSLVMYIDYDDFDNTIHASGRGADINNLFYDLIRINHQKRNVLASLRNLHKPYNIKYVIGRFKKQKEKKLTEYLTDKPNLINTAEKKQLLNELLYMDDWISYEKYNHYFPRNQVSYKREYAFDWKNKKFPSYVRLKYAYHYFLNRAPKQSLHDFQGIEKFFRQVEDSLSFHRDLTETLKLMHFVYLLRREFRTLSVEDLNALEKNAKRLIRSDYILRRFSDYLYSFKSSVSGGTFRSLPVTDIFCNRVDLSRLISTNKQNLVVFLHNLEDLKKHEKSLLRLRGKYPGNKIYMVFTEKFNRSFLVSYLAKTDFNLNNQFFLTDKKIRFNNFWIHPAPLVLLVNGDLQIKNVFFLKE